MSVFWPDKIEKRAEAALADVQQKLDALDAVVKAAPVLLSELTLLIQETRAELAAIKAIRERTFGQ